MEKLLKTLFDYQRFSPNAALGELIADTQSRYGHKVREMELTEDEVGFVAAAGIPELMENPKNRKAVIHPLNEDEAWQN